MDEYAKADAVLVGVRKFLDHLLDGDVAEVEGTVYDIKDDINTEWGRAAFLRPEGTRVGFTELRERLVTAESYRVRESGPRFHAQETPAKPGVMRAKVLDLAGQAVLQDRTVTHGGDLEASFAAIAAHWSVLFGTTVEAWQVPLAMNLLKIVRANHNPRHLDNWTDQAGYAAIGAELADEPV